MEEQGTGAATGSHEVPPMSACGLSHAGSATPSAEHHLIREDLGLAIVAAGCGGYAGGDIAARLVVDEIAGCFGAPEESTLPNFDGQEMSEGLAIATVRFAVAHAHARVRREALRGGPPGMSAAAAVLIVAGSRVVIGCAGDVRVYRFRNDELDVVGPDDTAPHGPAAAVGSPRGTLSPFVRACAWRDRDSYVVCSAGLHRTLSPEAIRCTLACCTSVREAAAALLGRAQHASAASNMTVVVTRPLSRVEAGK